MAWALRGACLTTFANSWGFITRDPHLCSGETTLSMSFAGYLLTPQPSWACLSCLHCRVKDTFTTSAKHHVELRAALGFAESLNRTPSTAGFHTEQNTDCVCVKEPMTRQGRSQVALCRLVLSNRVLFNNENLSSDWLHTVATGHKWLLNIWNGLV